MTTALDLNGWSAGLFSDQVFTRTVCLPIVLICQWSPGKLILSNKFLPLLWISIILAVIPPFRTCRLGLNLVGLIRLYQNRRFTFDRSWLFFPANLSRCYCLPEWHWLPSRFNRRLADHSCCLVPICYRGMFWTAVWRGVCDHDRYLWHCVIVWL